MEKGKKILHPLSTELNRLNTQTRGGDFVHFRFVCLFVFLFLSPSAVSVISSSRGSKPLTPRRYLGAEENWVWEGARRRRKEKWEQTDSVSVVSASAMGKKQTNRKKKKQRMRYVTNAAV